MFAQRPNTYGGVDSQGLDQPMLGNDGTESIINAIYLCWKMFLAVQSVRGDSLFIQRM